ncbi:transposase-like protein [Streptomyces canus]|uniref:Transposase-like protein n=1 Tax=Streptomyces canus TaxID=58343 RepID=A0AAW8F656_9ACTN|nr:transposase-like protein [Streptomyces canus]
MREVRAELRHALRHRQPRPRDKWHLDEVFIKINREQKYLWRAVDQDGNVLDILVQNRRDKAAARRFFRRLMKKSRTVPRVIVTDKLRSYGATHREVLPSVEHRQSKNLNNRAENSHQPTRQRERAMKGFRSVSGAQRFLSAFSGISPHFRPRRHLMPARTCAVVSAPAASSSSSRATSTGLDPLSPAATSPHAPGSPALHPSARAKTDTDHRAAAQPLGRIRSAVLKTVERSGVYRPMTATPAPGTAPCQ